MTTRRKKLPAGKKTAGAMNSLIDSTAIALFVTGLAGGFGHCIGMCGPVVAMYSLGEPRRDMLPHLIYNAGRISTYASLGAVAGFLGSFLALSTSIEPVQTGIMILAGISIILMGVASLDILPKTANEKSCPTRGILRFIGLFKGPRSTGTYFPMGVLLGFLPCGLTYTALLAAARASMEAENHALGMLRGGFLMLCFGLGTTPALLLAGKTISLLGAKMRLKFYRIAGAVMIVTGIYFTLSALR